MPSVTIGPKLLPMEIDLLVRDKGFLNKVLEIFGVVPLFPPVKYIARPLENSSPWIELYGRELGYAWITFKGKLATTVLVTSAKVR